jgi:BASS family bile acid:Na+ symporter
MQNVVMPAFAVALALLLDLSPVIEIALLAMALSPVPPILPKKQIKAVGTPSYVIAVLIATALFAIVFVPAATELVGRIFGRSVHVSTATVARIVAVSMLLPLLAGLVVRRLVPSFAERIAAPLSKLATVLLVIAFLPVLVREWRTIRSLIGNYTVVVAIVFVVAGLAVGHLLGGPDPDERTVLALATSTRHPAVAMAIAHDLADKASLLAALLLVLLVGAIVSGPYVKWRKHAHGSADLDSMSGGSLGRPGPRSR